MNIKKQVAEVVTGRKNSRINERTGKPYTYRQMHYYNYETLTQSDFKALVNKYDSISDIAIALNIPRPQLTKLAKKYLYSDTETYFEYFKRKKKENKLKRVQPKKYTRNIVARVHQIVNGIIPNKFRLPFLMEAIIDLGHKPECCDRCGYKKRREADAKVPLLMKMINPKDRENCKLDNFEFLCYNCYFVELGNVGGFFKRMANKKPISVDTPRELPVEINWQETSYMLKPDRNEVKEEDILVREKIKNKLMGK